MSHRNIFSFCFLVLLFITTGLSKTEAQNSEATLSVREQDRVRNLAANMSNKIEATNDRLTSILLRLNDRKNTLKEDGFSVSKASSELGLANEFLVKQRADFQNIDALTEAFVTSNNPSAAWADIKPHFLTSKNELGEVYIHLLNALELLKNAQVITGTDTDSATTTAPANSSTTTDTSI